MHAAYTAQQGPRMFACSTAGAHHLEHQPGQDLGLLGRVLQSHAARSCLPSPKCVCFLHNS